MLAAKYRNVCVVGDADQGVYSWRGATIQNILDFERDYPDAQVFLMEQNYRSTQNILAIANALIEHNQQRKPKALWTEAGDGELTVRFRAEDEHDEAFFVVDEIERLRESEGYRLLRLRGLLPDERAVPRARGRADARRHALPRVRRRAVLPAPRDQGRAGLPAADDQPAGRHLVPPRREHAEARHRRRHGGGASSRSRATRASRSCRPPLRVDEIPVLARPGRRAPWPGSTRSWRRSSTTRTTAPARRAWWSSPPSSPAT